MPAQTEVIPAQVRTREAGGGMVVELVGAWRMTGKHPSWRSIVAGQKPASVTVVPSGLQHWDSSLLLFLFDAVRWGQSHGVPVDTTALPESLRALLGQLGNAELRKPAVEHRPRFVSRVGVATVHALRGARAISHFLGECTISALHLVRAPHRFRWADCLYEMQQCGAMSLPIVSLISFLVGITLAYTGAIILRQYGGDIFVADLVGLSMVREMGAMMTAVVLAGRTGAAFAAQIGNMRANEEVDALVTFGFSPIEFLVMPRIVALALMMPLLAMYSNCLGILGGMVVAQGVLDIPPSAYWIEMLTIVDLSDLLTGIVKAGTFGLIVGLSGCLRGLQADRSAAGVGKAATSAVVTAILIIIVADSIFAVVFNILGL